MGFLLDTNVLSELIRPRPHSTVVAWFEAQNELQIYTSAITQAEMLAGMAVLPAGKRKEALAVAIDKMFVQNFIGRNLAFDAAAAHEYALLVADRKNAGLPISTEDAQIAAIALSHKLALVTRNTKDFSDIRGLQVINPWSYSEVKPN